MGTLTNILIILLLIVMCIQTGIEIYAFFINRQENEAFVKLKETFNNVQQDFANEKSNFRKIIEDKNCQIMALVSENNRLNNALNENTESKKRKNGKQKRTTEDK